MNLPPTKPEPVQEIRHIKTVHVGHEKSTVRIAVTTQARAGTPARAVLLELHRDAAESFHLAFGAEIEACRKTGKVALRAVTGDGIDSVLHFNLARAEQLHRGIGAELRNINPGLRHD